MVDFPKGAVFVLGGSGALGRAICAAFARAGVPVGLSYHNGAKAAEVTAEEVRALGVETIVLQADASNRASIVAALKATAEAFGAIHSVVYAGGASFTPQFFSKTDESVWQNWLQQDLMGAINLATAALPYLRETRGSFTALSTYQGDMIEVRGGPSAVSKAAVDRMVKVIAKEEGRHGVRANTVRCGWIGTEGVERLFSMMPHLREEKKKTVPLGRIGRPDEIGDTVAFLSSQRAGYITGVNLTADGGESL
ncbi:MAG: SDR family oxidoreductase [Sphingomonadaceae bacterium]|nr:SDR family oxidoreductase [Sphingomonadaceae bacterium]